MSAVTCWPQHLCNTSDSNLCILNPESRVSADRGVAAFCRASATAAHPVPRASATSAAPDASTASSICNWPSLVFLFIYVLKSIHSYAAAHVYTHIYII